VRRAATVLGAARQADEGDVAVGVSGAGALGLTLAQRTGFAITQEPGTYLSGAIVAATAAAWYGTRPARRSGT
jgi:hypothetical protein